MGPRPFLFGAMLASLVLTTVACRGKVGNADANSNLVGTWTRRHDGKIVQEITFTAAGTFDSVNPETGSAKEHGTYSVAPDGTSVTFDGTDEETNTRMTYVSPIRFNGKDEIIMTVVAGTERVREFTYHRKQ